ncbi:MAG: hydrolase [Clostridia bacterium]|nr:hydrolase [Clostridia bacterium]
MKNKFIEIYQQNIVRPGWDKLLAWLERSDFFTAPASSRFHLSREGGLCEHSLNVYFRLQKLVLAEKQIAEASSLDTSLAESLAICGLLHDVCKVNSYKIEMRNKKDEYGQWQQVPFYTTEDFVPYGHGEKSVYIVSSFIHLSREEAMAIRWHMGGFDDTVKGNSFLVGRAFNLFPLALQLHLADMQATYLDENEM